MRICKVCNSFSEDDGAFCALCGSKTTEYELAETDKVVCDAVTVAETSPGISVPAVDTPPSNSYIVLSYIGLGSSITSLVSAVIAFFVYSETSSWYYSPDEFLISFFIGLFALGGAIAGKCLISSAVSSGYSSGVCTAVKVLSTIALVLSIIVCSVTFSEMLFSEGDDLLRLTSKA